MQLINNLYIYYITQIPLRICSYITTSGSRYFASSLWQIHTFHPGKLASLSLMLRNALFVYLALRPYSENEITLIRFPGATKSGSRHVGVILCNLLWVAWNSLEGSRRSWGELITRSFELQKTVNIFTENIDIR